MPTSLGGLASRGRRKWLKGTSRQENCEYWACTRVNSLDRQVQIDMDSGFGDLLVYEYVIARAGMHACTKVAPVERQFCRVAKGRTNFVRTI